MPRSEKSFARNYFIFITITSCIMKFSCVYNESFISTTSWIKNFLYMLSIFYYHDHLHVDHDTFLCVSSIFHYGVYLDHWLLEPVIKLLPESRNFCALNHAFIIMTTRFMGLPSQSVCAVFPQPDEGLTAGSHSERQDSPCPAKFMSIQICFVLPIIWHLVQVHTLILAQTQNK